MRVKKKHFLIGAVIGTIVASFFFVFEYTKTPTLTRLTSYVSRDGGFSILYPEHFTRHINEVSVAHSTTYMPIQNVIELDATGQLTPYILIQFANLPFQMNVREYIENSNECEAIEDSKGEKAMIDGVEAIVYKNVMCNSPETRVYFLHNKTGYTININSSDVDEVFLHEFLHNFRFL